MIPIYIKNESSNELLAKIANDLWDLPNQIKELETWLLSNPLNLTPSNYIVDIGFSIRNYACGGGAILSPKAMAIMGDLGVKLYLYEYGD